MLTPIRHWVVKCAVAAKGGSTKRKYDARLIKLEEFLEKYSTEIPEANVQDICNELTIDVNVDNPLHSEQFLTCKSLKKRSKVFIFINTRFETTLP
jgi:hypothetical protein